MRILFLESHPMWIHGLPNGFRDAGHQVLISGALTKENIPRLIAEFNPDLIFTMGWGPENTSLGKQNWIREYTKQLKIPHVYWATEDPTHTEAFTIPFLKVAQPDFVFTICRDNIGYYESLGIKAAHLDFGFHPSVHTLGKPCKEYAGKIAVVANAYSNKLEIYPGHYRHESLNILIKPLLEANIRVDFYGKGWDKMERFMGKKIPEQWLHGYLPYTEAYKVYNSTDIIIGIQNHRTQLTQRVYEILASEGFLITNNTPEINRLFKAGQDLVISHSPQETLALIQYYLEHPEKRNRIKAQGAVSVQVHAYKQRAEYIIDVLNKQGVFEGKTSQYHFELMRSKSFIREQWELYTVCNGDTLWAISRRFQVSIEEIMKLNELQSDMIEAGQLLKIKELSNSPENKSSILIKHGNTRKANVALTYDAGDGAAATDNLLDILDAYGIKATFFFTGEWVRKYPHLARRIVDSGHEVGNHSFSHPDFTKISKNEMVDEIVSTEMTIKNLTGADIKPFFRPPFGEWSKEVLEIVGEQGYPYSIYWSLDTIDWKQQEPEIIANRVITNVKNDDIILMHLEYLNTAIATKMMIPRLKDLGYQFVRVSDLLNG